MPAYAPQLARHAHIRARGRADCRREFLRLGLDDLLIVARGFLSPRLSRSGLHRMLKRHEVPTLAELARQDAGGDEKPRHKPFKDYEPGYVHIDIKHLPPMPDEPQKRYLYVTTDRATRWVYLKIKSSASPQNMVERFNGRIIGVLATRCYVSSEDLEQTLKSYNELYSHDIPQKALHHQSPIAAMKEWQATRPELLKSGQSPGIPHGAFKFSREPGS